MVRFHHLAPLFLLTVLTALACGDSTPTRDDGPQAPLPVLELFRAEPNPVRLGERTELTYRVTGAASVSIDPDVLPSTTALEGTVTSPPITAPTTFTLRAQSARPGRGDLLLPLTVGVVDDRLRILVFEAQPSTVEPGQAAVLRWQTQNATRVTVAAVDGPLLLGDAPASGEVMVSPAATTRYRLTVEDAQDTLTQDVVLTVAVIPDSPVIEGFDSTSLQIERGQPATLRWRVRDAINIQIVEVGGSIVGVDLPLEGQLDVRPSATAEYVLTAAGFGSATARTTVTVVEPGQPRIVSFSATPTALAAPGDVEIQWETVEAFTVELVVNGVRVDRFPRTLDGQFTLPISEHARLVLVAENADGVTTAEQRVSVGPLDTTGPVIDHRPPPGGPGMPILIEATVTDAERGVDRVTLFYRSGGQTQFDALPMPMTGQDKYRATISASAVVASWVEYYIEATDTAFSPNAARSPANAPAILFQVSVGPLDVTGPNVQHTPPAMPVLEDTPVDVSARVTDAAGVRDVVLFFKRALDERFQSLPMSLRSGQYSATIPAAAVRPPQIDYFIEARDASTPANRARFLASPLPLAVTAIDRRPPTVVVGAIGDGQPFGRAITVSAWVRDAAGVGPVNLLYRSPALSGVRTVPMSGSDVFFADIPAFAVVEGVEYAIEASDAAPRPNVRFVPSTAPATLRPIAVAAIDTAPPTITHEPLVDGIRPNTPLTIRAHVVDPSVVTRVELSYWLAGGSQPITVPMTAAAGSALYSATVPAANVRPGVFRYYLQATDGVPNAGLVPSTAPGQPFVVNTGVPERESNDRPSSASLLFEQGLFDIGTGELANRSDVDHFRFDVPSGSARYNVALEITAGECTADTELALIAPDETTVLAMDDDGGVGRCSAIDAVRDLGARGLAPGRYFVRVSQSTAGRTEYAVQVALTAATCGNGLTEATAGETCDDGNTAGGDGCSASCTLEARDRLTGPTGTASGELSGDAEVFEVVIPQGGFITAETSNGRNGCSGDTILELYAPDGLSLIGTNDDDGPGACSRISPALDRWARRLDAGTYYLRVQRRGGQTFRYRLDVEVGPSFCGDGIVEGTEQCDDGNDASDDGCSAQCRRETRGIAVGGGAAFTDAIDPTGNRDWFRVVVLDGFAVAAETFAPSDGQCSADTVLYFLSADRSTVLTFDDDSGLGRCARLDPTRDPALRNLAAGDYFLRVEDFRNDERIPAYTLNVDLLAARCGDGYASAGEDCDDGNLLDGDGCNRSCSFEGTGEMEPNDGASPLAPVLIDVADATILGALQTRGDVDRFRVDVPDGATLLAEVRSRDGGCAGGWNLALLNADAVVLTEDASDGPGDCGRISPGADREARSLPAGPYFVEVRGDSSFVGAYVLDLRVRAAGCGDHRRDETETCDDGNRTPGDGCSATCARDIRELEANDTATAAQNLDRIDGMVDAAIDRPGDEDWYAIDVPAATSLRVATHDGAPDQCSAGIDTVVTVFDTTGDLIAEDDRDGRADCSTLDADELRLPAGRYLIRVVARLPTETFDYALEVRPLR